MILAKSRAVERLSNRPTPFPPLSLSKADEYQSSLKRDASVHASLSTSSANVAWSASFAGSVKYREAKKTQQRNEVKKFEVKSFCLVHHVGFATADYTMRDLKDDTTGVVGSYTRTTPDTIKIPFALGFDAGVQVREREGGEVKCMWGGGVVSASAVVS